MFQGAPGLRGDTGATGRDGARVSICWFYLLYLATPQNLNNWEGFSEFAFPTVWHYCLYLLIFDTNQCNFVVPCPRMIEFSGREKEKLSLLIQAEKLHAQNIAELFSVTVSSLISWAQPRQLILKAACKITQNCP